MAQCALRHDAVRMAWAQCTRGLGSFGCAPYALDPVLTRCTVLSNCLEHCSLGFQKKKKKIK